MPFVDPREMSYSEHTMPEGTKSEHTTKSGMGRGDQNAWNANRVTFGR